MKAKIIVTLGILAIALASAGTAQAKFKPGLKVRPYPINEYKAVRPSPINEYR